MSVPPGLIGPQGGDALRTRAPQAWSGWKSIKGAVNVALRASLRNSAQLNTATIRGIAGGRLQGPVGRPRR